jgi:hypothetical protein
MLGLCWAGPGWAEQNAILVLRTLLEIYAVLYSNLNAQFSSASSPRTRLPCSPALRFLLARLHIDSLSDNTTAKEVKSTLTTLSKGAAALDDAYREALERIEGQRASHSRLARTF